VPDDFQFATRTKKEIGDIQWHKLKDLPSTKEEQQAARDNKTKFWMVAPFIGRLKSYLASQARQKKKLKGQQAQPAKTPPQQTQTPQQQQPPVQPLPPAAAQPSVAATGGKAKASAQATPLGLKGGKPAGKASAKGTQPPRAHPFLDFAFDKAAIVAALQV
jgi:hypothetical protein